MTRVFSYSELEDWRQCPYKHQLAWAERWSPSVTAPALERGTAWHAVLATYLGARMAGCSPRRAAMRTARQHFRSDDEKTELQRWMFEGYLDRWGQDPEWEILAVEVRHQVPIAVGLELKIRADCIVRLRGTGRVWLVDAKSHQNLPREPELHLHPQFPLYTWALRQVGIPIWGSIHDAARTLRYKDPEKPQPLDERFQRTLIYHSDRELDVIRRDAVRDITIQAQMEKTWGEQPRHLDPDRCRHRCAFTEACYAGMRGQSTRRYLRDLGFRRDPTRH